MSKAVEDLTAIMDLLAEWRDENNAENVHIGIGTDGRGLAYSFDQRESDVSTGIVHYTNKENEPAGGNRTGSED